MGQTYQPLHHKYRPQRLDQLVGQQAIAATLSNALQSGRIAPAYLFSGPRGTGKTSSARILARSLNCLSTAGPTPEPCGSCELCTTIANGTALDVIEIDAASNTGVDNIRELIERSRFAPVQARWKVYVVDECHMLSTAAFNALLKTLEEPPPRVVFVLATTDPQRVLPTILSRCQRFDFRRIPLEPLQQHLGWIAEQEAIQITTEALHVVAQRAQGGLRDAESLLDQLSLLPAPVEADAVWELLGAVPEQELLELATALAGADPLSLMEACRRLLERGREPGAVLQGLASLLRDLVLAGVAPDRLELTSLAPSLRPQLPELARRIGKVRLLHWQAQLKGSEQQLRHSSNPRLWIEVLLLGLLAEAPAAVATMPARTLGSPAQQPAAAERTTAAANPATAPDPADPVTKKATAANANSNSSQPDHGGGDAAGGSTQVTTEAPANLPELWQQILAGLDLPSTRMLLSQQAQLTRLDARKAVVRVAGNWMAMVQTRLPLLEQAVNKALGSPRQVVLEAGGDFSPGTAGTTSTPSTHLPPPQSPPRLNQSATTPAPASTTATATAATSATLPSDANAPTGQAGTPDRPAGQPSAGKATTAEPSMPATTATATPSDLPTTQATGPIATPASAPIEAANPRQVTDLDSKAQRLAEFFNGEVVAGFDDEVA